MAVYDKGINYITGMNFIAAGALLVSDGLEVEAFQLIRYFYSSKYGLKLREFYMKDSPRLNFYVYSVSYLLEERFFPIYSHLQEKGITKVSDFVFQFLQSLYMRTFDFEIGVRLWDCLISFGPDFLIKFTIGFFQKIENENFIFGFVS